jgi:predicted CXXCH cytochrome family protein
LALTEEIVNLKRIIFIFLISALVMAYFQLSAQEVSIKLRYYSPQDLPGNPGIKFAFQGIPTVPVGQPVYLKAETGDLKIIACKWSVETPVSNSAELSNPAALNPTLTPYKEGQYKVLLTVTAGKGDSFTTSLWLTAGGFVGNGLIVNTGNEAQCSQCHHEIVWSWKDTPHADVFLRGMEGKLAGGYYRVECFVCHPAGGSGSAKIQEAMGKKEHWHFQEQLETGGFDGLVRDLPQVANLTGVQCESCHGPGSQHLGKIDKNQISNSLSPGVCVMCHDSEVGDSQPDQWAHSPHAGSMDTPGEQQRMNQPGCAHCHTAQGYWYEILGKKESAAPYKNAVGLTCAACHDPHDAKGKEFMLRAGKVENACTGCHDILVQNDERDFSSCPQGSILKGKGGMVFGAEVYSTGKHSQVKGNCAGCHMAKSPAGFVQRVGGHTFRVITKDQGEPVLNTAGCMACHDTMNLEMVRKSQEKIKQLLKELAALLPHREVKPSTPLDEPKLPQDPSLSKSESIASYNYYTVLKDGTYGVHNPVYIKKLLEVSIAAVQEEKKGP